MSRIFIIHGWGGSPTSDWFPWAKHQLKGRGHQVFVPEMPDTEHPQIKPWVTTLSDLVGKPGKSDILIGHSVGCQTILRYLESLPDQSQVAQVILVAPWVTLQDLESEEGWAIIDEWLKSPMDFTKINEKSKQFITIYSDTDPWVVYPDNKKYFDKHLKPDKSIVEHNAGHLHEDAGYTAFPLLLKLLPSHSRSVSKK